VGEQDLAREVHVDIGMQVWYGGRYEYASNFLSLNICDIQRTCDTNTAQKGVTQSNVTKKCN